MRVHSVARPRNPARKRGADRCVAGARSNKFGESVGPGMPAHPGNRPSRECRLMTDPSNGDGDGDRGGGSAEMRRQLDGFRDDFAALRDEVGKVIVGQAEIIDGTLTVLIAGGHVLLEGVPGLGKTLLVRTLAEALHLKFQRIQFTPDLMPADLIGTNVVMDTPDGGRRFEFQQGPVFANLLLADEINRATPKTQSALLEAMQEKHVTVAGKTNELPKPFFVLATQN